MKIPLKVEDVAGGLKPFAYFSLSASHVYGLIRAFVDTGSPDTIISITDAKKIGLPIPSITKYLYGYGGAPIPLCLIKRVRLNFRDSNNKIYAVNDNELIYVVKPTKGKTEQYEKTPSIIGVDFLKKYKLKLVFDPAASIAYLEKQ